MRIRIGVDGGGSKTKIVVLDPSEQVLRTILKPASNYHVVGMKQATLHILEGIREVLQGDTVEGIGITLAGIDMTEDWIIMKNALKPGLKVLLQDAGTTFQGVPVVLENDVFGALMSVQGNFSGNVLAAGTGAIALGINIKGEVIRVGGWGHIIGDEGAGYSIGRKALAAMVASYDGYGPKSLLETKITEYLKLSEVREILHWLYASKRSNREFAALVPVVVETAQMGDYISKRILDEAGQALGLLTMALLRKTHGSEMGLVGGISHSWKWLEPSFLDTIQKEFPGLQLIKPKNPPAVGSALLSKIRQVRHIEL